MELDEEEDDAVELDALVEDGGNEGEESGGDEGAFDGAAPAAGSSEATEGSENSKVVMQGARRRSKTAMDADNARNADWNTHSASADVSTTSRSGAMSETSEYSM